MRPFVFGGMMMRNLLGLIAAGLLLTAPVRASDFGGPSCNAHSGMTAVDMSQPTNTITTQSGQSGYKALKAMGVNTVVRYYDWLGEDDISCKALLTNESDALIAAGMNIISVFQHENDDPESFFIKGRGTVDAKHALTLARANGQPAGSAIYFSVDGVDQTIKDMVFEHGMSNGRSMKAKRRNHLINADRTFRRHIRRYGRFLSYHKSVFGKDASAIRPSDIHPAIVRYFEQVNAKVRPEGYKIGAYGSGAICELLLGKKLVDYCWLAQSTGWPGYDHFYSSKRWSMVQQKTTVCNNWHFANGDKVWLDFNRVSSTKGAWSKKDGITALASDKVPKSCN